jgi:hypothetical protein
MTNEPVSSVSTTRDEALAPAHPKDVTTMRAFGTGFDH